MDRTQLLKLISQRFSAEELHTLSFNLGIDYDNLAGSSKEAKARSLIEYCERTNQLERLSQAVQEERKSVSKGAASKDRNPVVTVVIITGIFAISVALINTIFPRLLAPAAAESPTSTLTA